MTVEGSTNAEASAEEASESTLLNEAESSEETSEETTLLDGATEEKESSEETEEKESSEETEEYAGSPEAYDDFDLPEGVTLSEEMSTELKTLAKELDLTQDDAQKIADLGAKQATRSAQTQEDTLKTLRDGWRADTEKDAEIGGPNLKANMAVVKKAFDKFGSPELQQVLTASGLGSHPAVLRLLLRAGKAISEDTIIGGDAPSNAAKSHAELLYPDNN